MENRLRGLLALMLCFILTVAPVAGAMAEDIFLYSSKDPILLGDLIAPDVRLTSRISGGVDYYTEGLYDPDFVNSDPDSEYPVSTSCPSSSIPVEASEDYEADLWAAANMFIYDVDNTLSLERVNMIVCQIELGDNVLLIMNGLQTIDSVPGSITDRKNKLESAVTDWDIEGKILAFYQMGVYANNTPVEHVMRRVDYNGDAIRIPLLYPDQTIAENWEKYDFALFHMNSNGNVEQIECTPSADGISFYASSFSPYALACKLKSAHDGNDGGTGDGGNGNNDPSAVTDLPKTGDSSNLMLWIVLSVMALAGVLYISRRRENA